MYFVTAPLYGLSFQVQYCNLQYKLKRNTYTHYAETTHVTLSKHLTRLSMCIASSEKTILCTDAGTVEGMKCECCSSSRTICGRPTDSSNPSTANDSDYGDCQREI